MHGRPRKSLTPEEAAASAAKALKLRSLQSQFLHNHSNKIYTTEAVELSAKLLEINPESYTAWNYRKLAVEFALERCNSYPESVNRIFEEELRVAEIALRQNFKSYGAWYHRKWVVSKGNSSVEKEMKLLDKFQTLDSRNFHAWNYRRYIAELMKRSDEDELNFTQTLIDRNFSNYSAWHNRSVILSKLMSKNAEGFSRKEEVLEREYEYVRGAIFTDEDDQSGWFYHLWLLHQTKPRSPLNQKPISVSWQERILNEETENFRLLSDCKIGKLTLARLMEASKSPQFDEILRIYDDLKKTDATHLNYYKDMQSTVLLQQKSFDFEGAQSNPLRLSNLSLSRVGFCETFLGVQVLDLSSNEIHSLEGMEVLQSLKHLNLSKNKIISFTKLAFVRQLKALETLDVSENRIGAYSIDTGRYLCESPLCGGKWEADDMGDLCYWEAYAVFKGLNLVNVDVTGNPVAGERFESFLNRILPRFTVA